MSEDRSYCCDEFEKALKEERLRPGIGRYWFYEISAWVYECPFCHTCPFCNRKLVTVTRERVSDRVDKEWEECGYGTPQYPHGPETYDVKGLIVNILTELGVVEEE